MADIKLIENCGGCVCSAIRYTVIGNPNRITVCHCLWCQRRTGTAFGIEVVFLSENVKFTGLPTKTYRHHSDESNRWLDMHFCPDCGTNLGISLEFRLGIRTIPAGTFDNPEWIDNTNTDFRHVYTRSQRHWGDISMALESYEAYFE